MGKPLIRHITFVKILIVLAIVFVISFGLCGITAASVMKGTPTNSPVSKLLDNAVPFELGGMLLSGVGIVGTLIAWAVVGVIAQGRSEPQRPYGGKDDGEPKGPL
jgi:predicted ABC-type sugar transport system permease subunit